jgi:hypothetical protein
MIVILINDITIVIVMFIRYIYKHNSDDVN